MKPHEDKCHSCGCLATGRSFLALDGIFGAGNTATVEMRCILHALFTKERKAIMERFRVTNRLDTQTIGDCILMFHGERSMAFGVECLTQMGDALQED